MENISRRKFLKGAAAGAVGVAALGMFGAASAVGEESGVNGVFTKTEYGFGGEITVTVTLQNGRIIGVIADGPAETADRGGVACEKVPAAIVEANSSGVDTLAGATITSKAIMRAVDAALLEAGVGEEIGEVYMRPGVYVGEGRGFDWIEPVRVKITVSETELLTVDLIELELNREEPVIQQAVIDRMIPRMIEQQSVGVDAVCGATGVSSGVKLATEDALKKALIAGGSKENAILHFYKAPARSAEKVELNYRVVVAGMGGAGTAAATSVAEQMKAAGMEVSVCAIETAGKYGGTASNAGESFAINPTRYMETYNGGEAYCDAEDIWNNWLEVFGQGDVKEEVLRTLFEHSGDTIDWMEFDHKVHLRSAMPGFGASIWPVKYQYIYVSNQEEGHDYGDTPLGDRSTTVGLYFDRMVQDYTALGGEYMLETTCTELLYEGDRVVGLKALGYDGTEYTVHADVVILAGGGFCGSPAMLEKYLDNEHYPLLKSGDWKLWGMYQNKGQMIESAIEKGAGTYNIDMVPCIHFKSTADILTCYPVYYRDGVDERMQEQNCWTLNDVPMIMGIATDTLQVGPNGVRNYNEAGTFAFWTGGPAWYTIYGSDYVDELANTGFAGREGGYVGSTRVFGQGGYPALRPIPQVYEVLEKAIEKGYVYKADSLEELAGMIGVPAADFVSQAERYQGYCEAGVDEEFGKAADRLAKKIQYGPYYAIKCLATPYSTVAALDVDGDVRVLKADGSVMNGLYACGNDSGGVLYTNKDAYAQYGGVALGWAWTSGRLVGIKAIEYLKTLG